MLTTISTPPFWNLIISMMVVGEWCHRLFWGLNNDGVFVYSFLAPSLSNNASFLVSSILNCTVSFYLPVTRDCGLLLPPLVEDFFPVLMVNFVTTSEILNNTSSFLLHSLTISFSLHKISGLSPSISCPNEVRHPHSSGLSPGCLRWHRQL